MIPDFPSRKNPPRKKKRRRAKKTGKTGQKGNKSLKYNYCHYKKGTDFMAEFKYEITKELGVISEGKYNIELNMVSWNDREPNDIRSWSPDHSRMGKGISLTEEEMERLVELWNTRDEEDSFEE